MGLLDRLFGYKKAKLNNDISNPVIMVEKTECNENCVMLMQFSSDIQTLLKERRYIAKSEYRNLIKQYEENIKFFGGFWHNGGSLAP